MAESKATRHDFRNVKGSPKKTSGKVGNEKHRHLLSNPRVKSWYDEWALRSRLSADVNLRKLGYLCERLSLDPDALVTVASKDPDRLHDLLVRYAADLKREGRLDSYLVKTFGGLRSWLRARRVTFDAFPRLSPIRGVSLEKETTPSPDQLHTVLYSGMSLRGRSSALFMAQAGLRPGVLGSYQARDGLTLGDLPELKLGKTPAISENPFVVRVPARLSKTRMAYTTFGTKELADTLLAYLKERGERGETLRMKSPVIAATALGMARGYAKDTGFLTTAGIVKEIREEIGKHVPAGVRWRPYVFRSYCSTRLMLAEGAGKITRDLREAILGHDTGVSGRYNVGKAWGPDLLKEARMAYKRAEPYLLTTARAEEGNENATRVIRLLLEARGVPSEKLDKLDIGSMSDEEIVALIKTVGASPGTEKKVQKAVPVEEVPKLLEEGWEYVAPLNGSMAVLKAPNLPRYG